MYQIIYLNGSSSSGKTTLCKALQERLEKPFLRIGIDQLISMMPIQTNNFNNEINMPGFNFIPIKNKNNRIDSYKLCTGSYGKKIVKLFKKIVVTAAKLNHNIIIDDVSFGNK